ncbi:MAG: heavy-metal-associated domain-containing protein [Nitriliruptorales bacterium]
MATETTFQITGVDCSHCAERLGVSLSRLDGVIKAEVEPVGTLKVRYDEARQSEGDLAKWLHKAGFDVA